MILQDILENKMENKYFTPDIEDIRVGYECEYRVGEKYDWNKHIVENLYTDRDGYGISELESYLKEGNLRTPYLTKEQIEAEGWFILGVYPGEATIYKKGEHELLHSKNKIKITKVWKSFEGEPDERTHRKDIYNGECKDINTLRVISKLLGIKKEE